ncbi:MAG: outer membrane protein assembly factor BamC [Mariprofundaceae bacterium]|nr:outer membrane protein assembly factor BamC [Mariprofundaceae bacterium]
MKRINSVIIGAASLAVLALSGCVNKDTKLLWGMGEGGKASTVEKTVATESRPPLDIPPSLLGKVSMPQAKQIVVVKTMPKRIVKEISGKQVSLDAKVYEKPVFDVFSAVLDAMTGLNLPVQSVDSASGTITTDWVRQRSKSASYSSILGGNGVMAVRYRFVTRVLKQSMKGENGVDKTVTRFEIHTLAQAYKNNHWSNTRLARRFSKELFSRVDENLIAKQ